MSDYIPEEVVINILARLPAKSLLRFRCVSKLWNSLISCPDFVSMHIHDSYLSKTSTPPPRILVRHYSRDKKVEVYSVHRNNETFDVEEDIKISFPFRGLASSYFRIVGFCNGLLCLSDDMLGYSDLIMLWNPLIRKKLTLPLPRSRLENLGPYMFILGFGYDAESKDFKVVRVAYVQGDHGYKLPPIVEIFSLKTGVWREISTDLPQSWVTAHFWSQAFVHGKVHWVAYKMKLAKETRNSKRVNLIMAFDLSSEVFEEIPLPDPLINDPQTYINSVVYEEKFSLIVRFGDNKTSIWVMEEYGSRESWIKMFNLEFDFLENVFGFRKSGCLLLTLRGEMIFYHPETERTSSLGTFATNHSVFADAYTESLALLIEGEQVLAGVQNVNESESDMEGDIGDEDDDVLASQTWNQSVMLQFVTAIFESMNNV